MSSEDAATSQQTILFADVVDSTGLYEAVGDAVAQATLARCMDLMEGIANDCGGAVRKRIGDEVLCTFPDPTGATRAAARMHLQVEAGHDKGDFPRPMRLRAGFEHGEVIERDGELFGSSVHTAARLAALAKAGQILTTRETFERVEAKARPRQRPFDRVLLKGQKEEREVLELLWSMGSTVLSSAVTPARSEGDVVAVELSCAGASARLDATTSPISIGRDEICGLHVEGDAVSRLHAKVSLDRGFVTFEDMSSNGSALVPATGPARDVRRTSIRLKDAGVLRLGLLCEDEAAAFVQFRCEVRADPAG